MNGSAKKLMAVIMVTAMIASAMVIVFTDEQDSSADVTSANYYRSQLDMDFMEQVYDRVVSMPNFGSLEVTINPTSEDKDTMTAHETEEYYLSGLINKGIIAAVYDNPLVGFYIHSTYPAVEISHTSGYASVTFTINKVDPTSPGSSLATYKDDMDAAITSYLATVDPSDSVPTKVTKIHEIVANTLTYSSSGDATVIRSVYTSLCGNHNVVCEGYAKMFKVLCDASDVPCLIVTGTAGTTGEKENHMWNYVQIDSKWYLVDCTWDDQASLRTEYLMAGMDTVGFDSVKVGDTYVPSGLDSGLRVNEALSYYSYGDSRPQYTVTFLYDPEMDPLRVYTTQLVGEGGKAFVPIDPADDVGHHFLGWFVHDSDTEFDFDTITITDNTTVDGKWTSVDVYTLRYDTSGGTVIQATRVEATDNVTKITVTEPKKEGFKFKEWNTAKDGKGMSYKGGEEITLVGDCTLYAIWEDTSSVTFKIDNTINKAAEFLSKESIPGVSNLLLTIGVITTVVSLIAVLAIARK